MKNYITKAQQDFWRKYLNQNIRSAAGGEGVRNRVQPGHIYIYNYESKLYSEGRLKYYDQYPLVLVIAMKPDGWLGLSLHYLPVKIREFFIKKVILKNHAMLKKNKPALVPYGEIKAVGNLWFKEGMVIIKRYLKGWVRSKIAEVPWTEWMNIVSGEGAQWIDTTAEEVYRETRKGIKKQYEKNKKDIPKRSIKQLTHHKKLSIPKPAKPSYKKLRRKR